MKKLDLELLKKIGAEYFIAVTNEPFNVTDYKYSDNRLMSSVEVNSLTHDGHITGINILIISQYLLSAYLTVINSGERDRQIILVEAFVKCKRSTYDTHLEFEFNISKEEKSSSKFIKYEVELSVNSGAFKGDLIGLYPKEKGFKFDRPQAVDKG